MLRFGAMPLGVAREPFDDPRWLFELKLDGFRALAGIDPDGVRLVSRRGHVYRGYDELSAAIGAAVRASRAVLDGELVCLDAGGRPVFRPLLSRRGHTYFYVFDVLLVDDEDLRALPLLERKRRLRRILRRADRVRYVDHVRGRGREFFALACGHDLEGIVAKLATGTHTCDRQRSTWLKVKNRSYSQAVGRADLFEPRRRHDDRTQEVLVMPKREEIAPRGDKRYIRRSATGTTDQVDVGRSLTRDRQQHAKTVAKPGEGDRGDRKRTATRRAARTHR